MPKRASRSMGAHQFQFHHLKQQKSSSFRSQLWKKARLVLMDVTPAQLMTEEVINEGNPGAPDMDRMAFISQAAFEIDDYWRIVKILHNRLSKFDGKHWKKSCNVLILLDYLLTHGPKSIAVEFQSDAEAIQRWSKFQDVSEKGFNWGLSLQRKSQRILKLFENGSLLKEEREQARRVKGLEIISQLIEEDHSWQEGVLQVDQKNTTVYPTSLEAGMSETTQTGRISVEERPSTDTKLAIVSVKSLPQDGWWKPPSYTCKEMMSIELQKDNLLLNFEEQIPLLLDYT